MSDDSGASVSDISSENQSFEERIRIKKSHSKTVTFSRKLSCSSQIYLQEIGAAETTLLEIQNEESREYEKFAQVWKECELIERIYQQVVQYVDCTKLQMKTSHQLSVLLNHLTLRENYLTEDMSRSLKNLCQDPELDSWNKVNSKIYDFMENFDAMKELKQKFDDDKNNYEIALKNFKMVLEFMSLNLKDLDKLKKQFEHVLWDYQHSRCLLFKNMTQVKERSLQFLGEICGVLDRKTGESNVLNGQQSSLFRDIENALSTYR
ncbi:uncharacterized protein LOC123671609 [Harmonia axyridis]|uniref:uncharacterized protein LOC123671609 n=1 Tax=Harmonia axyridis TaxID=115357 RepID=UPI001E278E85|nr:uncharacterized protein LOC123671609 [Harmonia axyridis]